MEGSPVVSTLSPILTLLLAVTALVVPAVGAVIVAFISRGGQAKPVALDAQAVIPRAEYDRLVDVCAEQDDDVRQATREAARLREQIDLWHGRALDAGWRSDR